MPHTCLWVDRHQGPEAKPRWPRCGVFRFSSNGGFVLLFPGSAGIRVGAAESIIVLLPSGLACPNIALLLSSLNAHWALGGPGRHVHLATARAAPLSS